MPLRDGPYGNMREMRFARRADRAATQQPAYQLLARSYVSANELPEEAAAVAGAAPVRNVSGYGDFAHLKGSAGTDPASPVLKRAATERVFLLIENTHAANDLYVAFGQQPSSEIGITIPAGEPLLLDVSVPQNDMYVLGSGAATTWKMTYCNRGYGQV